MTEAPHISLDSEEMNKIHERWVARRNRDPDRDDYREEWFREQCGACRFWFPLAGEMGLDYGACANVRSPFDGRVQFEHDGCGHFESAGMWISADVIR